MYGAKVETPLFVAVSEGYISTVELLMKLLPDSCVAVNHKHQNILHIAVIQNNKDMIRCILEYCPKSCIDQILNGKDGNGNTPLHLLISQGCFVPELITHKGVDKMIENKVNWTPIDMLYFQDEVIVDQVRTDTKIFIYLQNIYYTPCIKSDKIHLYQCSMNCP